MLVTTLVNAVSTQNAAGYYTNTSKTSFSATTTAFAIHAYRLEAPGTATGSGGYNVQRPIRVWFDFSPFSVTALAFATAANSPMCLEVTPKQVGNTAYAHTVTIPATGTYLYCWIEMPTITTAGGTITVDLVELN